MGGWVSGWVRDGPGWLDRSPSYRCWDQETSLDEGGPGLRVVEKEEEEEEEEEGEQARVLASWV